MNEIIKKVVSVFQDQQFSWHHDEELFVYLRRILKEYLANEVDLTIALLYFDRIYRVSPPLLLHNTRAYIITSLVLSLKYWHDKVHSNQFYSEVGGVTLQELNMWERETLVLLDYDLGISQEDYNQYWTQLVGDCAGVEETRPVTTDAALNASAFSLDAVYLTNPVDLQLYSNIKSAAVAPSSISSVAVAPTSTSSAAAPFDSDTPNIYPSEKSCAWLSSCFASLVSSFFLSEDNYKPMEPSKSVDFHNEITSERAQNYPTSALG